jgi:hypothetical protein
MPVDDTVTVSNRVEGEAGEEGEAEEVEEGSGVS